MGKTLRALLGAVALCMVLLPSVANAQRYCCDIADELHSKQVEYDVLDDRLVELDGNMQLGLMLQQQILMRNPFTEDDQQAWLDISGVILNINTEMQTLQAEQNALAEQIINLNQELSTCSDPVEDEGGPILPIPDPLMP